MEESKNLPQAQPSAIDQMAKTHIPPMDLSKRQFRQQQLNTTPEELNAYQSASVLMQALAEEAMQWRNQLSQEFQPSIIAILHGGIQIVVHTLAQVSFHGIRIEGELNGAPCSMLAHQSSVQLLCHAIKVEKEKPSRRIGFIWEDKEIEV